MYNKLIRKMASIILSLSLVLSSVTSAYAWNDTCSKNVYLSGKKVATLESRMWVSQLDVNFAKTKITFDATSSSWVFNATRTITNHVNSMTIKKTGLSGSLSANMNGVGASITEKTDSMFTISTGSANSYYRGMNTYNNTITRGVVGTIFSWSIASALTNLVVTGTSGQSVYIDGQLYMTSATVTAYF